MEQKPGNHKTKINIACYLWILALAIGTAIGTGVGAAIGRIGAGVGIGIGVGVAVGLLLYRRFNRTSSKDQHKK